MAILKAIFRFLNIFEWINKNAVNTIDPSIMQKEIKDLFDKARAKDEFEFVMTLINYRGMGHERGTSNLREWFDALEQYIILYKNENNIEKKARLGLITYSAFLESSDLYNILGSLARIQLGFRASSFLFFKHERTDRWLGIGEKYSMVQELLLDTNNNVIYDFFENNFVAEVRNSFIHSNYAINEGQYLVVDGDPIRVNGVGQYYVDIKEFVIPKIDAVIDFFEAFKNEYVLNYESYKQNKQIKGRFPELQDIIILGSPEGIIGINAGGSQIIKDKIGFWSAMNIRFNHQTAEDLIIKDELKYFSNKDTIKTNDGRLQRVYELIVSRNKPGEIENLSIIYEKFAIKLSDLAREQNHFKKISLYEYSLTFFQKSIQLSKNRDCRNRMAIVKAMLADMKGNTDLDIEAANDFIICLSEKMELNTLKNISVILTALKRRSKDISKIKDEAIKLVRSAELGSEKEKFESVLTEIEKI